MREAVGRRLFARALASPVIALTIVVAVVTVSFVPAQTRATTRFSKGDLFVGTSTGGIDHYDHNGVLIEHLESGSASYETGMCFDRAGGLYVTNFGDNTMSRFDNAGARVAYPFAGPFDSAPESCAFDRNGNMFVGQADGTGAILEFGTDGSLETTFQPSPESRGTDWIDLGTGGCNIRYTSEGSQIKQYNTCGNAQAEDFASGLPGPCYANRTRPDGSVLVACTSQVLWLGADGSTLKTYPASDFGAESLFAMNLDPDGKSFWTADENSGRIARLDITTGKTLASFTAPSAVWGLAVAGEQTLSSGKYVALGDSYSSGEGNPPFDPSTDKYKSTGRGGRRPINLCHRSSAAYSRIIAGDTAVHVACSGAVTSNVWSEGQWNEAAQINHVKNASLVTITIGGNDIGFANVVSNCVTKPACENGYVSSTGEDKISNRIEALKPQLKLTYKRIRKAAPSATIDVVGYPSVMTDLDTPACGGIFGLDGGERTYLRAKTGELDLAIQSVVDGLTDAGDGSIHFIEVLESFQGHEPCTPDPWIRGESDPIIYSFHPNAKGQCAMANLLRGRPPEMSCA